ncbi:MAG: hypothetical protein A4E32_01456 [Methanomassiliicoccales archaeon PtaU1.Bin124]|nr:MAG: hypothetical protein A4E32_01456 [Methanomassiliicoccales archaeon PtaU1.Bin124]
MEGTAATITRKVAVLLLLAALISPIYFSIDGSGAAAVTNTSYVETFDGVATGTTDDFGDVHLSSSANADLVVLDGRLWIMYRGNESREIMRFSPHWGGGGWNLSFEAYTPREGSSYYGVGHKPGKYGLSALLADADGRIVAGVQLRAGDNGPDGEGVYILNGEKWVRLVSDILPAYPHSGNTNGYDPDLYRVGMSLIEDNILLITVFHTKAGSVLSSLVMLNSHPVPELIFHDDVGIMPLVTSAGNYGENGGWFVDDLAIRPSGMAWPEVSPAYEYVNINDPLWLSVKDEQGRAWPVNELNVRIGGVPALFSSDDKRWKVSIDREVDWARSTSYAVIASGIAVIGNIDVTTTTDVEGISISRWWNGWSWATVFGLDDCSGPESAQYFFQGFDHPYTAYVFSLSGSSDTVLADHGEIALHYPHDYYTWMKKTWSESVSSARNAMASFREKYACASIWDDPGHGGRGGTFISLANPGNSATYAMMYAQYLNGVRIEGRGSTLVNGVPGNASLLGSYYVQGGSWHTTPGACWDPFEPEQLMDASRQWSLDYPNIDAAQMRSFLGDFADNGGLLRVYGHPDYSLTSPTYNEVSKMLRWICNSKTDGTPENWKATDGEAASYIYSRHTTSLIRDLSINSGTVVMDVARKDPKAAGYWNTPVTVDIDLSLYNIRDVKVIDGGRTFSMLDGTLKNLDGAREMAVGYDIRDNHLYISHFFNSSAKIVLELSTPIIINEPFHVGLVGQLYNWTAIASKPNKGPSTWHLDQGADAFLRIDRSNDTSCTISGIPSQPGEYHIVLRVGDNDSTYTLEWTLRIGTEPDDVLPSTVLLNAPTRFWMKAPYIIALEANDTWSGVARTMFAIDDHPFDVYTSEFTIAEDGFHTLTYYSIDWWGNVENSTTVRFGIDTVAPSVSFDQVNGVLLPRDVAYIGFRAVDVTSQVRSVVVRVDSSNGALYSEDGVIDLTGYRGAHNITVVTEDGAGNINTSYLEVRISSIASYSRMDMVPFFIGSLLMVGIIALAVRRMISR